MSLPRIHNDGPGDSNNPDYDGSAEGKSMLAGSESKPLAVVVSGVGSNKGEMKNIIEDLEEMGFKVEHYRWNYLGRLPPAESVKVAVGHSAGGSRVEVEYGNSSVQVMSLSSPTNLKGGNIQHSANRLDPISHLNPLNAGKTGQFTKLELNPHSKDTAWDKLKGDVVI